MSRPCPGDHAMVGYELRRGEGATKVAPRRLTTSGISEAGSLWHRLPPMVPRLRTE